MISDTDWAYLAALIDGEGCIGIYEHTHQHTWQPRVVIAMSTEQPLKWVYETFGCRYSGAREVKANGRVETRYRWGVYSREGAYLICQGVLPYLKLKGEKAEEVIRYFEGLQQQSQDVA